MLARLRRAGKGLFAAERMLPQAVPDAQLGVAQETIVTILRTCTPAEVRGDPRRRALFKSHLPDADPFGSAGARPRWPL